MPAALTRARLRPIPGQGTLTAAPPRITVRGPVSPPVPQHEPDNATGRLTTSSRKDDRLAALLEVARLVAAALDLETLYLALHEQFQKVVDATGFALVLTRGEGQDLDVPLRVLAGKREPVTHWPWSNGVVEYVIRTRQPLILADRAYDRALELGCEPRPFQPPRSWIAAPVRIGDRVLGVLSAQHHERDFAFDATDVDLLTALAQHVAVALENARLFDLLRQTEARYRTLFLDLPIAVFVLDESARIQSLNPAATRLAGRAEADLAGQRLSQLMHPNERDAVERLIAEARAGRTPPRREVRIVQPDGAERVGGFTIAPLEREGGGSMLAVVRDMTHEDRLRQNLIQTEKMAAMGLLLSGIAHELNNPLAGARGAIQLALADADPANRELLESALQETDRAATIVQRVREVGRRGGGAPRPMSLNELVQQVADLRSYALRNQNITLETDCDPRLPEILGDPDDWFQALMNLLQNAEQALWTMEGERRITLGTRARNGEVEIIVSDTGPGIPAEVRDRVFDPFFTTKAPGEGTGLGLTVVHAVVDAHGGRIEVGGAAGGGATIRIVLPERRARVPTAAKGRPPTAEPATAGLRILMVEDEATIRDVVRRWCERRGYVLTMATDGRKALELIAQGTFDAVLLDLRMPGMDGRQLYRALSEARPDLAARVIFVTGDAMTGDAREFLEQSGRPVLLKPFDLTMLGQRLAEVSSGQVL